MKTNASIQIGKRIKHFRELAGLSQLQLAQKVPCESSTLAHYETGKNLVSMTKLLKIAEVLEVEPYQFFISSTPNGTNNSLEELNPLLTKANKVQLNLINTIIRSILELTSIE